MCRNIGERERDKERRKKRKKRKNVCACHVCIFFLCSVNLLSVDYGLHRGL